jgi:hypothetical protein
VFGLKKINRKGVPKAIKDAKLKQGKIIADNCGPMV